MPPTGSAVECRECGKSFAKKPTRRIYCSNKCRGARNKAVAALRKQEGVRECRGCRIWFRPIHHSQVYCDPDCKHDHIIEVQRKRRIQDRMMTPGWSTRCRNCAKFFVRSGEHRTFCSTEHREDFFKTIYMPYYRKAGPLGRYSEVEDSFKKMAKVFGYG